MAGNASFGRLSTEAGVKAFITHHGMEPGSDRGMESAFHRGPGSARKRKPGGASVKLIRRRPKVSGHGGEAGSSTESSMMNRPRITSHTDEN